LVNLPNVVPKEISPIFNFLQSRNGKHIKFIFVQVIFAILVPDEMQKKMLLEESSEGLNDSFLSRESQHPF